MGFRFIVYSFSVFFKKGVIWCHLGLLILSFLNCYKYFLDSLGCPKFPVIEHRSPGFFYCVCIVIFSKCHLCSFDVFLVLRLCIQTIWFICFLFPRFFRRGQHALYNGGEYRLRGRSAVGQSWGVDQWLPKELVCRPRRSSL